MDCSKCNLSNNFTGWCNYADMVSDEAKNFQLCKYQKSDMRDKIIFGKETNELDYIGGIEKFEELKLSQIEQLLEKNLIDLDVYHNNAPTARELIDFVKQNPIYVLMGYCVSPNRGDFRISFDGIQSYEGEFVESFEKFKDSADEYSINPPFAWWD